MGKDIVSPLSNGTAHLSAHEELDNYGRVLQENAWWVGVSPALDRHFQDEHMLQTDLQYTPDELSRAWAYLRSLLWRMELQEQPPLVCLMLAEDEGWWQGLKRHDTSRGQILPLNIERIVAEASVLSLKIKQRETIANLFYHYQRRGELPPIPYGTGYRGANNIPLIRYKRPEGEIPGFAYGAVALEYEHLMQTIIDEEYIGTRKGSDNHELEIKPKAFHFCDNLRLSNEPSYGGGFFVRRFDRERDKFFEPIFGRIESALNISIRPVWGKPHNEKIDERVLRLIREADVIVVDATDDNFNVGLEFGYAMALNKEIVLIRRSRRPSKKSKSPNELPFDIRTVNCYFFSPSNEGEVEEVLTARIAEGLRVARLKRLQ